DDCKDLSPGTSCGASDPCLVGFCTQTGCQTQALMCNQPPPSECIGDTLRTYNASGVCSGGTCNYQHQDMACPGCPSCAPPGDGPGAWPSPVGAAGGTSAGATGGVGQGDSCGVVGGPEAVYVWTPATSGTATISTCGSAAGGVVAIDDGACGAVL